MSRITAIIVIPLLAIAATHADTQQAARPFTGHPPDHPLNLSSDEWLRVLSSPDVEERRRLLAATSGAYKVDLSALRPALLRALEDQDDFVRFQAAATLNRNGRSIPPGAAADETLQGAMRVATGNGRNRTLAIEALGAFADQSDEARRTLIELSTGRDHNAAQTAAKVASHASDATIAALADAAVAADDPRTRMMIYMALGEVPDERSRAATNALFRTLPRDDSNAFFAGIRSLIHLDRPRLLASDLLKGTLPRYLAALQPPDKSNAFAAMTVGLLGADAAPAIPHLVRHAVWVRHESTGSVEQKGWNVFPVEVGVGLTGAAAVQPLLSCLDDDDPRIREQAAKLLLTLVHFESEVMADKKEETRRLIREQGWPTSGGRPSPELARRADALVKQFEQEDRPEVRRALAPVLAATGPAVRAGTPALLRMASSPDLDEAIAALYALRHIAPDALHKWPELPQLRNRLVHALSLSSTRHRAISALGALQADAAGVTADIARAVAEDVKDSGFPLVTVGENVVHRIGPAGIPGLVTAVQDPDPRVRRTALALLTAFEPVPPEAIAAAQAALHDRDPAVRESAEVALRLMTSTPGH